MALEEAGGAFGVSPTELREMLELSAEILKQVHALEGGPPHADEAKRLTRAVDASVAQLDEFIEISDLPRELSQKLRHAKDHFTGKRYGDCLDILDVLIPELKQLVRSHPANPEGHFELSGVYFLRLLAAGELPAGPQRSAAMTKVVLGNYPQRIRQEILQFVDLAPADHPKRESVQQLLRQLDALPTVTGDRCPEKATLELCQRIYAQGIDVIARNQGLLSACSIQESTELLRACTTLVNQPEGG